MNILKQHGRSSGYIWKYTPIENFPDEIWKEIKKYPTYFASNKGRIKHTIAENNEYVLNGKINHKHLCVHIGDNTHQKHRLVCKTFKGKKPNKDDVVNHIDGNGLNNDITNLEWVTRSENTKHAYSLNLIDKSRIEKSVSKFDLNGKFICEYSSIANAADTTDIDASGIAKACKGKLKTAGGFKWKYTSELKSLEETENELILIKNNVFQPVSQYSLNGKLIAEYQSIAEAERETHVGMSGISKACKHKALTAGGFIWKYTSEIVSLEEIVNKLGLIENKGKPVSQYSLTGELIAEYPSMAEAAKETHIGISKIRSVCKHKTITAGGFIWKYTSEIDSSRLIKIDLPKYIYQYSLNGELICKYPSIRAASRGTDIDHSAIAKVCSGKLKTAGGFKWELK